MELLRYRRAEALRPFLSELSQEDLSAFVDRLMGRLQSWRRFNDIGTLLEDPRRYVEDIVFALARNRRDGRGRVEQTFLLQVRNLSVSASGTGSAPLVVLSGMTCCR